MIRGTTPTIRMNISGINVTELSRIYITFRQGEISFDASSVTRVADGNYLVIELTQTETLSLIPGEAWVQMRALTNDNNAIATQRMKIDVGAILKEGLIS